LLICPAWPGQHACTIDRAAESRHHRAGPAGGAHAEKAGAAKGGETMPYYLCQVGYNEAAAKKLIANPQSREDAIKQTCASLGGNQHSFLF
jgi:hypothetical protein